MTILCPFMRPPGRTRCWYSCRCRWVSPCVPGVASRWFASHRVPETRHIGKLIIIRDIAEQYCTETQQYVFDSVESWKVMGGTQLVWTHYSPVLNGRCGDSGNRKPQESEICIHRRRVGPTYFVLETLPIRALLLFRELFKTLMDETNK